MYVSEFVCGVVFTILAELAISIAGAIFLTRKKGDEEDETADHTDSESK